MKFVFYDFRWPQIQGNSIHFSQINAKSEEKFPWTHTHHGWKMFLFSNRIRLSNRFHFVGFIQFPSLIAFRFSRTLWLKYQENKCHFKSNLEFFRYSFFFICNLTCRNWSDSFDIHSHWKKCVEFSWKIADFQRKTTLLFCPFYV